MSSFELRTASAIAAIFFARMMGLFMVMPVMSLYGMELKGASLTLLGIAIGVYGLTQALLQIPLSMLSDIYGRKRIMLWGLAAFVVGSFCAIFADNIWALIACRALQGAGAIAGTSMALLADSSTVQTRTKVMAFVGISIGASFVFSLIAGPLLANHFGLQGIFIASTILAVFAFAVCFFIIEEGNVKLNRDRLGSHKFLNVMKDKTLMSFFISVFILHLVMTASFVSIPIILEQEHLFARDSHWKVYLGVFFVALLLMGPFARPSTDPEKLKKIYSGSTAIMGLVLLVLAVSHHAIYFLLFFLCIYFTCFNLLEALLPSLLSQHVDEQHRATAMGAFSTFQFMGAFFGGLSAGIVMQYANITYLLVGCGVLVCFGLVFAVVTGKNLKLMTEPAVR